MRGRQFWPRKQHEWYGSIFSSFSKDIQFPNNDNTPLSPLFFSSVCLSKDRKLMSHLLGVTEKIQCSVLLKSVASSSLDPPMDTPGENVSSKAMVSLHSNSKLCIYYSSILKLLPLSLLASITKNISIVKKQHDFFSAFNWIS